ncbi:polyphosphate--glucose phosphotransferase [Deinococcus sp. JMULE3]|uniref:polyphosphate--glucose phosphotransferase n=1 Tax=Deinococcus sp. JMULE3 TaxID=2518341 RepID=UPI0015765FD8|nr:ROK family protein [Deinococcus sp. JMULE3]NTX99515.1 ROK family protein [Deinococcus sp. JMULE3]
MSVILGIDIGGSGIKGAPVDTRTGQLTAERRRIPTPEGAAPDDVKRVVQQLVEHFGLPGPVGVTFPGIVQRGHTLSAANVHPDWVGLNADALFTDATGHDVHLINDADAAGLAEARFGAGQGEDGTVLVLTFGTGIGSALIHRGVLIPNTELGHLWLRDKHAETWASDRARERDDLNWKQWSKRACTYLQHLELLFSPDLFIIGGGISKKAEKWQGHLKLDRSRVVPARLLNEAGIIGAAMMAAGTVPDPTAPAERTTPAEPTTPAPRKSPARRAPRKAGS